MSLTESAKSTRSKATVLLLVVLYLGIFTAHDLIFHAVKDIAGEVDTGQSCYHSASAEQSQSIEAAKEHYCPFCSGFVDNHANVDIHYSSNNISDLADDSEGAAKSLVESFNNPRDPPFLYL